jgi:hypothetical protein
MRQHQSINLRPGELLHVETPNGIVNIRTGLNDARGREVDSVECIPDRFSGERKVVVSGRSNTRLIRLKTVKS